MNMRELNGSILKKRLGAKKSSFLWHNKNKSGGNFGLSIMDFMGHSWAVSGYYDTKGDITDLQFGRLYSRPYMCNFETFESFVKHLYEWVRYLNKEESKNGKK